MALHLRRRSRWALSLGALVVATSACGPIGATPTQAPVTTSSVTTSAQPQLSDIAFCALTFITPRFANNPNGLRRAAELLEKADKTKDLTAAAIYVYGRQTIRDLAPDEQNELILIITGIDSCGNVSEPLRQSADGILDILRSLLPSGGSGPEPEQKQAVLCPGIDPFGPPESYRFEPSCAASEPTPPKAKQTGDVPDFLLGNWKGEISQDTPPSPPFSLAVTIRQGATGSTVATGDYKGGLGDCSVLWTLQDAQDSQLIVNEVVESGNCFNNIQVTITARADGTLNYDFENGNGHGILHR